ncbi:hypothetical protein DFH28DRAFT_926348 [Melampsora americana]|nr:hypothetical protein DFH28DRAFT_926348 [Melampsora americana]
MSPPHRAAPLVPQASTHEQQISNPTYHPPIPNPHNHHPDAVQSTRSPPDSQSRSAVLYVQSSPSLQLSPTLSPLPSTSSAAPPPQVVDRGHKRIKGPVARSAAACNLCRSQKAICVNTTQHDPEGDEQRCWTCQSDYLVLSLDKPRCLAWMTKRHHMKCEGPNHAPCRRCVRNNVDCVFGESQGRARQILWSKRTEELEMKVMKHEEELKQAMSMIAKLQQQIPELRSKLLHPDPSSTHLTSESNVNNYNYYPKFISYSKALRAAKPGPRRSDLVDRGKLSEHTAKELFEIHRSDWAPQIPWLNLPDSFDNVRDHSPLMLAVGCSTGAKGKRDVVSYRIAKSNVIELVIDVLCYRYFPHDQPQSYQDVVAIIGCIVHCGLGLDPALVVDYAEHLRVGGIVYACISPHDIAADTGKLIFEMCLIGFRRKGGRVNPTNVNYCQLRERLSECIYIQFCLVLMLYCDIICQSPFSDANWDGNLKYFVEYYALMEEAQINLDSHYRLGAIDLAGQIVAIEKYSALVSSWKNEWESELKRKGNSVSSDAVIEFELMYHRGMTYLACFATAESRNGREILSDPRRLRLAHQGVNHGIAILKQFIDSRLAQPDVPCVHVIKDLTDELRKEGDEWGGGTEDSYVTTLQKLSSQLDEVQAKRTQHKSTESSRGTDDGNDFLTNKTPVQPRVHLPDFAAPSISEMPKIVVPEDQMKPPTDCIGVTNEVIKEDNATHTTLPVAVCPSSESIHGSNAVTSGWLVDTATFTENQYGHQPQEMLQHEIGRQSMMTSSPTPALIYEPLCSAPPPPWTLHDPSSPVLHFSPTSPQFDHFTQLHQPEGPGPDPNGYESYGFQSQPNLSDQFQPQNQPPPPSGQHHHHQFHQHQEQYRHPTHSEVLQPPTFVVPEQTSEMLQSLRSVYSDRLNQSYFQTSL